jgi:K+-transporting ATPase ATPase C chain
MKVVMKNILPAFKIFVFMTLLCGLLYPLAMTGIAKVFFARSSAGEIISRDGKVVGSVWMAQKFEKPEYFWPRPSAVDYNPLSSGGSNLGGTSQDLKKSVDARREKLQGANPGAGEPPQDLLFASASGLDPDISPVAAHYQIARVALARHRDVAEVEKLIEQVTEGPQFGILGESRVNVLKLNLALDSQLPEK